MHGPKILVRSMVPRIGSPKPFKHGNRWQYHSRSDHHSKIACWGFLLDLLHQCALLRVHASKKIVGFGLNHEMRDFRTGRRKNLDLVICRPRSEPPEKAKKRRTFTARGQEIGAILDESDRTVLAALPELQEFPVGAVHIAVEAKACMTAFTRAKPRLYDELNSSHLAIHGNSAHTIAAGLAMVNIAPDFISPGLNNFDLSRNEPHISRHNQPRDAASVIDKIREIPRRSGERADGFDALAIMVVDCRNDGTPVTLVETPPAPQPGDIFHYEWTVHRLAQLYEQRFRDISP